MFADMRLLADLRRTHASVRASAAARLGAEDFPGPLARAATHAAGDGHRSTGVEHERWKAARTCEGRHLAHERQPLGHARTAVHERSERGVLQTCAGLLVARSRRTAIWLRARSRSTASIARAAHAAAPSPRAGTRRGAPARSTLRSPTGRPRSVGGAGGVDRRGRGARGARSSSGELMPSPNTPRRRRRRVASAASGSDSPSPGASGGRRTARARAAARVGRGSDHVWPAAACRRTRPRRPRSTASGSMAPAAPTTTLAPV